MTDLKCGVAQATESFLSGAAHHAPVVRRFLFFQNIFLIVLLVIRLVM